MTKHNTMNKTKFTFVDLGLPSGKLWATENVKNENGDEGHFTFDEAVETFGKNLPSMDDWEELIDNCSYKWNKKKKGFDITGANGNFIFLPAADYRSGDSVYYWSSSVYTEYLAYYVLFDSGDLKPQYYFSNRYVGFSVRLVK